MSLRWHLWRWTGHVLAHILDVNFGAYEMRRGLSPRGIVYRQTFRCHFCGRRSWLQEIVYLDDGKIAG